MKFCCASINYNNNIFFQDDFSIKIDDLYNLRIACLNAGNVVVCNKVEFISKIGVKNDTDDVFLDVLELWAFCFPNIMVVPTVRGLCDFFFIQYNSDDEASCINDVVNSILSKFEIEKNNYKAYEDILFYLNFVKWGWAKIIAERIGFDFKKHNIGQFNNGLKVWKLLTNYEADIRPRKPMGISVGENEIEDFIKEILNKKYSNQSYSIREEQVKYSKNIVKVFEYNDENTNILLSQAETGVGKTIGYIAPSVIWSKKNDYPVWISTYTKNLQHQIYNDLKLIYPDKRKICTLKGRENYICLTRFEALVNKYSNDKDIGKCLAFIARWILNTKNGDIMGDDFLSWLFDLVDRTNFVLSRLIVKRDFGETHRGCVHDKKCFVDNAVKKSFDADIVITNHAYIMSMVNNPNLENFPKYIIFDEGHHLNEVADSAFCGIFSIREIFRIKSFIINNKDGFAIISDNSGFSSLVDEIFEGCDEEVSKAMDEIINSFGNFPSDEFNPLVTKPNENVIGEMFFHELTKYVLHMNKGEDNIFSIETTVEGDFPLLRGYAESWKADIFHISNNIKFIVTRMKDMLITLGEGIEDKTRLKFQNIINQIEFRTLFVFEMWHDMLSDLAIGNKRDDLIDRFFIDRVHGKEKDIGMARHVKKPIEFLNEKMTQRVSGYVITSATLLDGWGDDNIEKIKEEDTKNNKKITEKKDNDKEKKNNWINYKFGIEKFKYSGINQYNSDFDYENNALVIIVDDVDKSSVDAVSHAYLSLFNASGGGGLGIFTSILRCKQVFETIMHKINDMGLNVYCQHSSNVNISTLINIFKNDKNSCLLGTDAIRDGVDVPGNSLRLIVQDRIPWVKPDIVYKVREESYGKDIFKSIIRSRIKQSFGRLIRKNSDVGVYVILQPLPSYLKPAFPKDIEIVRCGLSEACEIIRKKVLDK